MWGFRGRSGTLSNNTSNNTQHRAAASRWSEVRVWRLIEQSYSKAQRKTRLSPQEGKKRDEKKARMRAAYKWRFTRWPGGFEGIPRQGRSADSAILPCRVCAVSSKLLGVQARESVYRFIGHAFPKEFQLASEPRRRICSDVETFRPE